MVVGYLDIFVFEELGFTVGPVVDGFDDNREGYAISRGTVCTPTSSG